ncbi:Protein HOL1 [Ceratocystis fimbriata CBS 114723]|uniref:Protein HOL1 n=1 Tax=Ceratocystis fimbriata CBS 114723 TaxID=1035309 RepID=A0A2C5WZ63_9PEZI|nr:Protein HOL1 [Ceratocystis fimbriata CBS 114723]
MDNSQAQDRFAFRLPDWKPPFTRKKSDESTSEKQSNKSSSWRLGILNPPSNVDVPGSVQIFSSEGSTLPPSAAPQNPPSSRPTSQDGRPTTSSSTASSSLPPLKYTTDGTIILNPQPEDNINDPLNWPSWRRETALLALGFFCMVGGGMTPILAAGFGEMAVEYDIDMESAALTTGLFMMGLGIGSVIASPTAILYGKRPVYLAGALLFIITSIWAAVSPNYSSLIFARIFQGIAASPVECLPASTITDIFFLHERAYRIGIYMLMLLGGNNLLPLVSAVIMHNTDWSWVFWIAAMAGAVSFMLLFFLVPETFWNRLTPEQRANKKAVLRATSIKTLSSYARTSSEAAPTPQRAQTANTITVVNDSSSPQQRPRIVSHSAPASMPGSVYDSGSESDSLSVPTPAATVDGHDNAGNKSNRNSRVTFAVPERPVRPRTFTAPENAVAWSSIVHACSIGWLIVISELLAMIYRSSKYYNFNTAQTGLVYLSPFVGAIAGTAVAGRISDFVARSMTRRNGGLYEPEFRLIMALPITVTTVIGLIGFGWAAQERDNFMVPTFFLSVISFGCSLGSTTATTFTVDSYEQYAGEALVTLSFSKNIFHGLVFSLFVTDWLSDDGPKKMFVWIGVIQLLVMSLSIPMYMFGKRARMWTARKGLAEKL